MGDSALGSAILLGILQGLTEFLPISSSGHLAAAQLLFPALGHPGVTLEVATHLGTTAAVIVYYRDLVLALAGLRSDEASLLGLSRGRWIGLLVLGSVPTGIIAWLLRDAVRTAFDSLLAVAAGLALTGVILMSSRLRAPRSGSLGPTRALLVGVAQGLAVFPGISRSGSTITAAMLAGVQQRRAVTFSLLLSIPAIVGASLVDSAQVLAGSAPSPVLFTNLVFATLAAGLVGYICIGFVHRATRTGWWHRFAWYCWAVALVLIVAAR